MYHAAAALACLVPLLAEVGAPEVKPTADDIIRRAVDSYQPSALPKDESLRGFVVGIHATDAGRIGAAADAIPAEDFALLVAGHLFHFVSSAKGVPVVCPAETQSAVSADAVFREKRCDFIVALESGMPECSSEIDLQRTPVKADRALAVALVPELKQLGGEDYILPPTLTGSAPTAFVWLFKPPAGSTKEIARRAAREQAVEIFRGMERYARNTHKKPPAAVDDAADESEDNRVPRYPRRSTESRQAALARQLTGGAPLADDKVDWFVTLFARTAPPDRTLVHFAPTVRRDGDAVVLSGTTNVPSLLEGLEGALTAAGVKTIRNEIKTLPNRDALGPQMFGACKATMALVYDKPSATAGVQTQLLYGEPVFLLDRADGWLMLQGGDGYWGWVREEAIHRMNSEEFDGYRALQRVAVTKDLQEDPGSRRTPIPRGAKLAVIEKYGDGLIVRAPDLTRTNIPADAARPIPLDPAAEDRVLAALDMLYTPYKWGGRSPLGLDCSGLITNVAASSGHVPPRDAWQQALVGELVATEWHRSGIRRGDLLYFIDGTGRVYHTAIAIDSTHFVHAAVPEVQIGSFDRHDRLYDQRLDTSFFIAKRP